ncbi:VOC family protein, partial [Mesorhizobium sp. M2D.F.Ca.ET.145.01.1.1]
MTMPIASLSRISDVCLLVADIERTVEFYVEKLGFRLR